MAESALRFRRHFVGETRELRIRSMTERTGEPKNPVSAVAVVFDPERDDELIGTAEENGTATTFTDSRLADLDDGLLNRMPVKISRSHGRSPRVRVTEHISAVGALTLTELPWAVAKGDRLVVLGYPLLPQRPARVEGDLVRVILTGTDALSYAGKRVLLADVTFSEAETLTVKGVFEVTLDDVTSGASSSAGQARVQPTDRVFVVHGHDQEMKQGAARALEKLGLEAIILHEQPDEGLTVIEKIAEYSDVGFAVVCLSADDMGCLKTSYPDGARPRARQNVIFELGFFIGRLGRSKVVALYPEEEDFELPSDYEGVLHKAYDKQGHWRFELVKELKAAGYDVDADDIL